MTSVLLFSGGKDSLACLHLLREKWGDELVVLHIDTGAKLPEVVAYIDHLAEQIPNFRIVKSDQPSWVAEHGQPVDVLPIAYSAFGQRLTGTKPVKLQPYVTCCEANLWKPTRDALSEINPDVVYHGSKRADVVGQKNLKGKVGGFHYEAPVDGWTDEDVMSYLNTVTEVPPWFSVNEDTSMDCWNCTAFMRGSKGRVSWLREHHPEKYKEFAARIDVIRSVIVAESEVYQGV